MKLILSRKGFDASSGGMASPILPDGRLLPLPIPSTHDHHSFADLPIAKEVDLGPLLADLSHGRWELASPIHRDPDLGGLERPDPGGWRPAFGQCRQAQAHLRAQGVGIGDVFLFFGWFRAVQISRGRWCFVAGSPDLHVIFGWLEIGAVLPVARRRQACLDQHPWIADHPHVANPGHYRDPGNTVYLASARSRYGPSAPCGGGRFPRFSEALCLTRAGCKRSVWSLPQWWMPTPDRPPLSYHRDPRRWTAGDQETILRSVSRGQEFVLDAGFYPEAEGWIRQLLQRQVP